MLMVVLVKCQVLLHRLGWVICSVLLQALLHLPLNEELGVIDWLNWQRLWLCLVGLFNAVR